MLLRTEKHDLEMNSRKLCHKIADFLNKKDRESLEVVEHCFSAFLDSAWEVVYFEEDING